jgi:hypothetical protein
MEGSRGRLLEREVGDIISTQMLKAGLLTLKRLRLSACEMDLVLLDPRTLRLANMEIKRRDWRKLLWQANRAKLYCHFSLAVLPASMRPAVREQEFGSCGIGLIYYQECLDGVRLEVAGSPSLSNCINRPLKRLVYRSFHAAYGDIICAPQ